MGGGSHGLATAGSVVDGDSVSGAGQAPGRGQNLREGIADNGAADYASATR
ncbi:hypothetical protein PV343_03950 [Streptomyces sp. WI03-4A]|uniref:hypothetical protein n=1 Tax=Streptomyces sp. WI03-4A TaxID=3028706 RepID=UPI0029A8E9D1|nr:hypothetical protein [Streptomyces sp. WI03-4A]MDX2591441.1 hypothetical protein [Streptomyces sp. WI03-4A]